MRIKNVKDEILGGLKDFAKQNGFKIRKGDFKLLKSEKIRDINIHFTYNTWGFAIELFPMVCISFKEVHRICEVNGYDLNYSAFINILLLKEIVDNGFDYQKKWELQLKRADRIPMEDDTLDYPKIVREVLDLMPYAMDFINDIQDYKDLDRVYNTFPIKKDNNLFRLWNCTQCIIGLIAAKLANNPRYDEVKDIYTDWMKTEDCSESTKVAFYKIKEYLETYDPEQSNSLTESKKE